MRNRSVRLQYVLAMLAAVVLASCTSTRPSAPASEPVAAKITTEQARNELTRRGIAYTESAFVNSALAGNLEVVKLFVWAGMPVTTTDRGDLNLTPLHKAAKGGHLEIVKYLVEQGAFINATTCCYPYQTPKDRAQQYGHTETVAYLESVGG